MKKTQNAKNIPDFPNNYYRKKSSMLKIIIVTNSGCQKRKKKCIKNLEKIQGVEKVKKEKSRKNFRIGTYQKSKNKIKIKFQKITRKNDNLDNREIVYKIDDDEKASDFMQKWK